MSMIGMVFIAAAAMTPVPPVEIDTAIRAAIEATCFDYLDGQLEGDPQRVAKTEQDADAAEAQSRALQEKRAAEGLAAPPSAAMRARAQSRVLEEWAHAIYAKVEANWVRPWADSSSHYPCVAQG